MAKKRTTAAPAKAAPAAPAKLGQRDKKTLGDLRNLADGVVEAAERKREPFLEIPTRALSNVRYNKTKRFIEMGGNNTGRNCLNFAKAMA